MPRLSAAIIARDESRMLPDCLASLAGVADEVVVLDTGSVDDTREIARRAGARVDQIAWPDSFAAARNAAIDRCRGDWILYIDCDERVRPGSAAGLQAALAAPRLIAQQVRFHVRPGFTPYWELRLFRNHPALRFTGAIHETIWPAVLRLAAAEHGTVDRGPLTLDHLGYEGDPRLKHGRDLPLLLQALQADPLHTYCWSEVGRIHLQQGEHAKARAALRMGADIARAKPFRVPQDSLCFVALATLARQTGDPPPGPLLEEAMALFPDHPHLLWLAGQVAQDEQRFAAAAEYFEALRRFDPATFIDPSLAFDRRMFDLWAVAGLAAARLGAGEYPAAAALYAEASRGAPDVLEYRLKQALAARLAAGPVS